MRGVRQEAVVELLDPGTERLSAFTCRLPPGIRKEFFSAIYPDWN